MDPKLERSKSKRFSFKSPPPMSLLDSKCIEAIKNSRKYLCLISRAALKDVRDFTADHTYDELLIEYQTGLKIHEKLKSNMDTVDLAKGYLIPVHIGHDDTKSDEVKWFRDFDTALYPNHIGIIPETPFTDEKGSGGYIGDLVNGKREGRGVMKWPNYKNRMGKLCGEVIYDGEWKNDKMSGRGKIKFKQGHIYEGDWRNNTMHGIGKYSAANGDVYVGQWYLNNKEGEGSYRSISGTDKFVVIYATVYIYHRAVFFMQCSMFFNFFVLSLLSLFLLQVVGMKDNGKWIKKKVLVLIHGQMVIVLVVNFLMVNDMVKVNY